MCSVFCTETQGISADDNSNNNQSSLMYTFLEVILDNFNYTSNMESETKYIKNIHFSECDETTHNTSIQVGDYLEYRNSLIHEKNKICCDCFYSCCSSITYPCIQILVYGTIDVSRIYIRSQYSYCGTMSNFQSMIIGGWEGLYGSVDVVNGTSIAGFSQESITSDGSTIRRASNIFAGGYQAQCQQQTFQQTFQQKCIQNHLPKHTSHPIIKVMLKNECHLEWV